VAVVLVVENDRDIRELLTMQLAKAGFEVIPEADGERGLRAALERPPAVAVLDWAMPGLTGVEICRRLRREAATAGVKVMLLSATGPGRPPSICAQALPAWCA
jgi:DNA-binding response OmpR family regulator